MAVHTRSRSKVHLKSNSEIETELLTKFDISSNGFLPDSLIDKLPRYFDEWENIVLDLPKYLDNATARDIIVNIPELDAKKLTTNNQIKRAYSILSLLVHAYVWCETPFPTKIPKNLAVPYFNVATKLGIVPVLTHASVDLFNWQLIDPNKPVELDNMRSIRTFTGKLDEEWFYLVMVDIEAKAAPLLKSIYELPKMIDNNEIASIRKVLNVILKTLREMIVVLNRMYEKCDPDFFFNTLRPYLSGWTNTDIYANGMIYEGTPIDPQKYFGGSGAQSSVFQVVDGVLEVGHKTDYFRKIRKYMPEKHRNFIEYVENEVHLREYVDKNSKLKPCFNECVEKLLQFRKCHMDIVREYVFKFADTKKRKRISHNNKKNLSGFDSKKSTFVEPVTKESINKAGKGSGGTNIKDFLGGAIVSTASSKLK